MITLKQSAMIHYNIQTWCKANVYFLSRQTFLFTECPVGYFCPAQILEMEGMAVPEEVSRILHVVAEYLKDPCPITSSVGPSLNEGLQCPRKLLEERADCEEVKCFKYFCTIYTDQLQCVLGHISFYYLSYLHFNHCKVMYYTPAVSMCFHLDQNTLFSVLNWTEPKKNKWLWDESVFPLLLHSTV